MAKKKKKKCAICLKHDHCMDECAFIFRDCSKDCSKGDECKYWCMVDLCTNFHKLINKFHKPNLYEIMEREFVKLDAFEDDLDSAFEYHEDPEWRRRRRSCSSMKRVEKLQEACVGN